ncbi:hypothetical protein ACFVH0_04670 [Streptomyces sp. NPDC127117]|uniref:hypothetical protein n=1 Tax=Streptomyces sp. NPDC127117 TaxID=3345368 RepID=UPI003633E35C
MGGRDARSESVFSGGTCKFLPSYTLKTRKDGNHDFATDNGRYRAVLFRARAGEAPVPEKYVGQWVPEGQAKDPKARVTVEQAKTGEFSVRAGTTPDRSTALGTRPGHPRLLLALRYAAGEGGQGAAIQVEPENPASAAVARRAGFTPGKQTRSKDGTRSGHYIRGLRADTR